MNLDPNRVIFDFVDSSWSFLSKITISHLNFLSDLIKFEEHFKNTLILCGFENCSPLFSLIRDYNIKLASVDIFLTLLIVFSMNVWINLVRRQR